MRLIEVERISTFWVSKQLSPTYISSEVNGMKGDTASFPSSSGRLFDGYFSSARNWKFGKNDLIDARGRRLFETTAMACHADAYPFQIPLEARTGPEVQADGHSMLMLSSYDYLGLIGDPRIDRAAIEAIRKYGTGTGGARLLTGTTEQHQRMEEDLAAFRGTEAAITFSSGYAANVAVIGALLGPADRVIMDALCHRSLTDACRFAGVQLQRFQHNDPGVSAAGDQEGAAGQPHSYHYGWGIFDGRRHLPSTGDHRDQEEIRLLSARG